MSWMAAGATLLGGVADYLSDERQRRDNDTYYRMSREDQERDRALQKEFAQNGIKWRMEDAERAGVHPLYALGASGATYSPTISTFSPTPVRSSAGDSIRQMGQDVSRAAMATRNEDERMIIQLQIEGLRLDNAYKLQKLQPDQIGPPLPLGDNSGMSNILTGQGDSTPWPNTASRYVNMMPFNRVHSDPSSTGVEAGSVDDIKYVRTFDGKYRLAPSQGVKQLIEDMLPMEIEWQIANNILPRIPFTPRPPAPDPRLYPPPKGYMGWKHSRWDNRFHPAKEVHYNFKTGKKEYR